MQYDDVTRFSVLLVMCEKCYREQLKISTCVKCWIDAYQRYILPFRFRYLNSGDYHGDSLNVMFTRFPNCFLPFPLMFFVVVYLS